MRANIYQILLPFKQQGLGSLKQDVGHSEGWVVGRNGALGRSAGRSPGKGV